MKKLTPTLRYAVTKLAYQSLKQRSLLGEAAPMLREASAAITQLLDENEKLRRENAALRKQVQGKRRKGG